MSTQDVVDMWKREAFEEGVAQGVQQGVQQGLTTARHTFLLLYEARFGKAPRALRAVVESSSDLAQISRWSEAAVRGAQAEIDAALAAEKKPASRSRAGAAAKKASSPRIAPPRAR